MVSTVQEAIASQTERPFWQSSTAIVLAKVVGTAATAANSFILAAVLGPADMGLVAILVTAPTIVVMLTSWGVHFAGVYHLGQSKYSKVEVVSSVTWIGVTIGLILILMGMLGRPLIQRMFPEMPPDVVVLAVVAILPKILVTYFSEISVGLHRLGVAVLMRALPGILYLAGSLFLVVFLGLGVGAAMLAYVVAISSAPAIAFVALTRDGYIRPVANWAFAKEAAVFGTKSHLGDVAQYAIYRVDLPLVGYFAGLSAAGFYSVAVRIAELLWLPSDSVRTVLMARLASKQSSASDPMTTYLSRNLLAVGVLSGGAMAGGSVVLMRWLLPEYLPSIPLLLVLLPGVIAASVFRVLSGDITGRGYPGLVAKIAGGGLVVGLVLYFVLIPRYGGLGAALSSTGLYLGECFAGMLLASTLAGYSLSEFVVPRKADFLYLSGLCVRVYRSIWERFKVA